MMYSQLSLQGRLSQQHHWENLLQPLFLISLEVCHLIVLTTVLLPIL